jgi:UDP-glucose 4-epimerase
MVERALQDYDRAYGLRSACLRYFNAAGAHPDGLIGERHEHAWRWEVRQAALRTPSPPRGRGLG